ncbi:MAG: sensor histidine kinase [Pseudonocardiales bacterium]|nr:sensor histidine kinase [Pseudonocardiales bacterium]
MVRSVQAHRCGVSLAHQALLYRSQEEFLTGTVPFIRDGLECGDPIQIATTDRNAEWLRVVLGADVRRMMFGDCSQWYGHPVRALVALCRTVQAASRDGHRLRIIGEPLWTARTAQETREWARHDSLINAALAVANVALLCLYDTGVVDSEALANVARTHPELVVDGSPRPSPGYTDPSVFNAECNRSPLPELPPPILWLRFRQLDQLATLRVFVTSHASHAGVAPESVEQFVQAVDEVATNAIEHGGGSAVLQLWIDPNTMVCEISDTGTGLRDPLAGQLPPDHFAAGGHGLWLARQLSDLLELHSDPAGTTVRLYLSLP